MATIKTAKQDIINNFSKYLGRQPNATEIAKYQALPPATLESDLKTQYQKITGKAYGATTPTKATAPTPTPIKNKDYNVTGKSADGKTLMGTPKDTTQQPAQVQEPQKPQTTNTPKQIYRDDQGNIFDASTGQKIPDTVTLNKDYKGATEIANPNTPVAPTPEDINSKLKTLGLSDDTINGMDDSQKNLMAGVGAVIAKQYEQSNPVPQTFTADDLNRMLTEAQNDPTIDSYYKDQLRIGTEQFTQTLALQQQDYAAKQASEARQAEADKKSLAESQGAGGAAYSGFSQQAKEKLSAEQTGIIESTRRQEQQAANTLGGNFEQNYGTTALQNAGGVNIAGQAYNPLGNVAGTQAQNKLLDIRQKNQDLINNAALTRGLQ